MVQVLLGWRRGHACSHLENKEQEDYLKTKQ